METNIVSQDNSATPLLNFGASQLRAARSDDGLQLNAEGKQGQICHSVFVFFFVCVCVCKCGCVYLLVFGCMCVGVDMFVYICRPAYPSIFARISTEISHQCGCMPIFLKIRTQNFQKVWKL